MKLSHTLLAAVLTVAAATAALAPAAEARPHRVCVTHRVPSFIDRHGVRHRSHLVTTCHWRRY